MLHYLGYAPSDGISAAHSAALLFSDSGVTGPSGAKADAPHHLE